MQGTEIWCLSCRACAVCVLAAPGAMPTGRYQHGAIFVGNRLHISGGAVGGGRMVRGLGFSHMTSVPFSMTLNGLLMLTDPQQG